MKNEAQHHEAAINLPPAVKALCLILLALTAVLQLSSSPVEERLILEFGLIPARYTGGLPFDWAAVVAPLSHMFLHGGWLHLGVNLGMLMAFGSGIERAVGAKKFLILYFASGLIGALAHFIFMAGDIYPLIGASGAISGLFGAVMMMMKSGQENHGGGGLRLVPMVVVWVAISVFFGVFGLPGQEGQVAWIVHVGGFLGGLLLLKPVAALKI